MGRENSVERLARSVQQAVVGLLSMIYDPAMYRFWDFIDSVASAAHVGQHSAKPLPGAILWSET